MSVYGLPFDNTTTLARPDRTGGDRTTRGSRLGVAGQDKHAPTVIIVEGSGVIAIA
jgi:hypothetical protein